MKLVVRLAVISIIAIRVVIMQIMQIVMTIIVIVRVFYIVMIHCFEYHYFSYIKSAYSIIIIIPYLLLLDTLPVHALSAIV